MAVRKEWHMEGLINALKQKWKCILASLMNLYGWSAKASPLPPGFVIPGYKERDRRYGVHVCLCECMCVSKVNVGTLWGSLVPWEARLKVFFS